MELFDKQFLVPPQDNELEISIFGPGYGESIALHIPHVGWGIIDSCIKKIHGKDVVPSLEYLTNLLKPTFPKLAFLLLTHPHQDHYKGFAKILREYPGGIERVGRYEGTGIRELKTYIAKQRVACGYDLAGLADVFKEIEEAVRSGVGFIRLSELKQVFSFRNVSINGYGPTDIAMMALSPSAMSSQEYEEILFKAYPRAGEPVLPLDDKAHNLVSVALLLQIGKLQIILGSDVEAASDNKGWIGIISNKYLPDLWANLIKVAHHGSEDAYNELAWGEHSSCSQPIAVITPFFKGNTILPTQDVVNKIKNVSDRVGLTTEVKFEAVNKYYKKSVARSIMSHTRSAKIIDIPDKIGLIRARFHLDGEVTELTNIAPATWI